MFHVKHKFKTEGFFISLIQIYTPIMVSALKLEMR